MKDNYDLNDLAWKASPYAARAKRNIAKKKQISLRLESGTIDYFQHIADDTGQTLQQTIRHYLKDAEQRQIKPIWK